MMKTGINKYRNFETLWKRFGDVPIDENECIEEPFLHFDKGTNRFEVWHWFEQEFDVVLGEDV